MTVQETVESLCYTVILSHLMNVIDRWVDYSFIGEAGLFVL